MAWIGAFVVGICVGLLGSGGSILNIPILIYVAGETEKKAIAESLVIVGLIALFACIPYARKKLVVWRSVLLFGAPGMAGAYSGAMVSGFVPAAFQLTLLALVMLVAAFLMFQPPFRGDGAPRAYWKIASDGFLVGGFTGLVGVGGGFLIVPTLTLLGGLSMHEAVGTSLVIIALNSLAGYTKHHDVLAALGLSVNWGLVWSFAALGVVGSFTGSHVSHRIRQSRLRKVFAIVLLLVGIYMTARNLPHLVSHGEPDRGFASDATTGRPRNLARRPPVVPLRGAVPPS